jgi:sucrose phosphorylase
MADLVINHVSVSHPWFRNYLADRDPGKNYFIEAEPRADYSQVTRPRSSPLFTPFETPSGVRKVWTTFSADQADLNFANPDVLIDMIKVMLFYLGKGIRIIRLDAIAFLWKVAGTTCLHLPETHQVVKLLRDIISRVSPGAILLTETNVPNRENWSYFGAGDEAHMVYQFSLPPLLLHALFSGCSKYLSRWAAEIPVLASDQTFLNYTASHDGIGVRPLEGLLPQEEIGELIAGMKTFGGLVSSRLNPDGSQSPYEINMAWLDAMKGDRHGADARQKDRFICSQTIMMALQGIPAFYIHSLLGTPNDLEGLKVTGRARSINRKQWLESELLDRLRKNTLHHHIFHELCRLIRIRRGHTAFHPGSTQQVLIIDDRIFALKRHNPQTGDTIYSISNITGQPVEIPVFWKTDKNNHDLISDEWSEASGAIRLKAYQTRWFEIHHLF